MSSSPAGPARRAVLRWAWRLFRREWRQQVLMLALMTTTVAVAIAVAAMAVNSAADAHEDFGAGGAISRVDVASPEVAAATIAAAESQFGPTVEVVRHASVAVPGAVEPLDVRTQDPAGVLGDPLLDLRDGRYPRTTGEVALTDGAAELLAVGVGDRVDIAGRQRTVVGRVENPRHLHDEFALLAPADDAPTESLTFLLHAGRHPGGSATRGASAGEAAAPSVQFLVLASSDDASAVAGGILAVATLVMCLVALVSAAGFLVVAKRRQRQLGLLAALGARPRHQRLVMIANGTLVGMSSALGGAALGVLGWIVAAPAVETAAGRRFDRFALPWLVVAATMALAVVAATAAAWWPARSLTRQPIMAALSRRPTPSSSVKRTTAGAGAFVLVGMVAVAASRPTADDVRPVVLVVGLVALVVGVVLSTPFALRALAAPAGRLPLAARMAVRDLVRHQSRAGAALAAITLGLAVSMAVTVLAKANEYRSDEGNLSDRQLVVRTVRQGPEEGGPSEADRAGLDAAAARVGALLPGAASYPLDVVMDPAAMEGGREPVTVARQTSPHSYRFVDDVYVATPELLRHFGIDDADVTDGAELLTAASGEVFLFDPRSRPDPAAKEHVAHVVLSPFDSAPRSLVLPSAVEAHGWTTIRSGWFIEAPGALTPKQLAAARRAAADLGVAVEARSTQDDLATLRTIATSVGVLLALAIIGMTIGLLRSESAADLRTLTATGATSRTRRALTANTAASLAVLGVVLGTGGAYAALIAAYRSDLTKLTSPPLAQLAAAVIGIPVLAAVGGWLVAGREPATFSRSALD